MFKELSIIPSKNAKSPTQVLAPHAVVIGDALDDADLAELAFLGQVVFCGSPIQDLQVVVLLENKVSVGGRKEVPLHDVAADVTEAAVGVDELCFRTSF